MKFVGIALSFLILVVTLLSPTPAFASMELRSIEGLVWRSTYSPEQTEKEFLFDETRQILLVVVNGNRISLVDKATRIALMQFSGTASDLIVQKINVNEPQKTFVAFIFDNGGSGGKSTTNFHFVGLRRGDFVSLIDSDSLKQIGWSGHVLSFSDKTNENLRLVAYKSGVKQRIVEFVADLEWDSRAEWVKLVLR